MSLKVTKAKFLVIGKNGHIGTVRLYIMVIPISQKRHEKFLGIAVDGKLEWREHINYISVFTNTVQTITEKCSILVVG